MINDFKENKLIVGAFWLLITAFLGVCVYFMIHNAYWQIEDEAIVIAHTGMGKAFSPTGFECMVTCYGRLYPFAYNLYNVLLMFHDGFISPTDHYILQSVALLIYAMAFASIALFLSEKQPVFWKYAITFCFVAVCVARVYTEFITCYTGMWIVFMFLPVFIWTACKFFKTEKWGYGVVSLLVINYINYCYETVFVIPLAIGACSLLFNYKLMSKTKILYNWLLMASGLLFLLLYAIIVLPRASHYYRIQHDTNFLLQNMVNMFFAQKIYWIALVVLVVRAVALMRKKSTYSFYDSILLAAFAYFCGAAVLGLDFTYYYNVGSLTALVSILHFLIEKLKPQWTFVIMACLAAFYCRKIPQRIRDIQSIRVETYNDVTNLSKHINQDHIYWYAPQYKDTEELGVILRGTTKIRLETYLSWLLHKDVYLEEQPVFDDNKHGIWLFPSENNELFPDDKTIETVQGERMFGARGITGFYIR